MSERRTSKAIWQRASYTLLVAAGLLMPFATLPIGADAAEKALLPLPDDIFRSKNLASPKHHNLAELANEDETRKFSYAMEIPKSLSIRSEGAQIQFDAQDKVIHYSSTKSPIQLIAESGMELSARRMDVNFAQATIALDEKVTIYFGDSLARAQSGTYNWKTQRAQFTQLRAKVNGVLVLAESGVYATDAKGRRYIKLRNTLASAEDVENPSSWVGFRDLTLYPGDYGRIAGLSYGKNDESWRVPILGWLPLSHSLNIDEGYLPIVGSRGIWGAYWLNRYGFLLGNKRIEKGVPTADHLVRARLDYRTRRGFAYGLDWQRSASPLKNEQEFGLSLYYADDMDPQISATNLPRDTIKSERYRIALREIWQEENQGQMKGVWRAKANIDIVSDAYMLRDYFEDISRVNDKPDNTIALTFTQDYAESSFLGRFAPNDYYAADERVEWSYYRVRQPIGKSRILYETRNSFGVMRQKQPLSTRLDYQSILSQTQDPAVRDYYMRLLNTDGYSRFNSTHELTSNFKIWEFLNVTPKAGASYTGYYGLDGIGSENRFTGYLSVDFDLKLHRKYPGIVSDALGIDGLTHTLQPYATFAYNHVSSTNELIPQIDTWSTSVASSAGTPMPLDLSGFVGPDGWSRWSIWRMGLKNYLSSVYDDEKRLILKWNAFMDLNIENPVAPNRYSNLYSILEFELTHQLEFGSELQLPFVGDGDEFSEYNHYIDYQFADWGDIRVSHRQIQDHSILEDSNQISFRTCIRLDENYSFSSQIYWDYERKTLPIQQYSVFRNTGAWQIGVTVFLRDNDGRQETGFGLSFSLSEIGVALPINFF